LTQEEIKNLITNPDPHIPSHHQVDPRIMKAYLMGESIPTYLPGHLLPCYFGIFPTYLPRDLFHPSEWADFWSTLIIARIIIYGSSAWMQIKGPLII
jgi:hypothetical protein